MFGTSDERMNHRPVQHVTENKKDYRDRCHSEEGLEMERGKQKHG